MFDPKVHAGVALRLLRYNPETNGNEVLLLLRSAERATHGAGTWGLPGGWIDYGQSPQEAAVREAMEEIGLTLKVRDAELSGAGANAYDDLDMHVICLAYDFTDFDDLEIKNMEPEKHTAVEWVPLEKLSSLPLFPPLHKLAEGWGWV